MFKKIKKWYEMGLWTEKHVVNAYKKGVITAEQLAVLGLAQPAEE